MFILNIQLIYQAPRLNFMASRGASGCLLFSFANRTNDGEGEVAPCQVTKTLIDAMQSPDSTKTYFALCDGNGNWNGVDYRDQGWFTIDKPVKDEYGKLRDVKSLWKEVTQ